VFCFAVFLFVVVVVENRHFQLKKQNCENRDSYYQLSIIICCFIIIIIISVVVVVTL